VVVQLDLFAAVARPFWQICVAVSVCFAVRQLAAYMQQAVLVNARSGCKCTSAQVCCMYSSRNRVCNGAETMTVLA
jgi:hypothetical protein